MFEVNSLLEMQLEQVKLWHSTSYQSPEEISFEKSALQQHNYNFELWHQEDLARDPSATDQQIANVKRNIDRLNQNRNDKIECLDEQIILYLQSHQIRPSSAAQINSETPGSVIDRLSINALKIYHMKEELLREDVDKTHYGRCQSKLEILMEQRHDLGQCLVELMSDLLGGKKFLKIYRQMKMYNDPTLNPVLYGKK